MLHIYQEKYIRRKQRKKCKEVNVIAALSSNVSDELKVSVAIKTGLEKYTYSQCIHGHLVWLHYHPCQSE